MAAANGVRPAASVRLFCARLDRGDTACLRLAAWVALFAHVSVLLAWLRQRHQARRIGSLLVQAPSSGRHAPCRGWGRWASPRGTSAAMALPTASAAPRRLAFRAVPSTQSTRTRGCRAGADCRERRLLVLSAESVSLFAWLPKVNLAAASCPGARRCACRRLLPVANAFRPAHRPPSGEEAPHVLVQPHRWRTTFAWTPAAPGVNVPVTYDRKAPRFRQLPLTYK